MPHANHPLVALLLRRVRPLEGERPGAEDLQGLPFERQVADFAAGGDRGALVHPDVVDGHALSWHPGGDDGVGQEGGPAGLVLLLGASATEDAVELADHRHVGVFLAVSKDNEVARSGEDNDEVAPGMGERQMAATIAQRATVAIHM